ncbi:MAG: hypothetical protein Ta2A_22560 [Treponemataceae bacterium]|nr:MAG: hypothetical protein Ta2A_22560 [Treponemataceae bacterium]
MLKVKLIFSACLGTAVYACMLIFFSNDGLSAYKSLEAQKYEISKQLNEITGTNNELYLQYNALKQDSDVIASYARKLGYVSDNEKLLKINGLKPLPDMVYDPGSMKTATKETFVSEYFCKTAGLLTGIVFFLFFVFIEMVTHAPSAMQKMNRTNKTRHTSSAASAYQMAAMQSVALNAASGI